MQHNNVCLITATYFDQRKFPLAILTHRRSVNCDETSLTSTAFLVPRTHHGDEVRRFLAMMRSADKSSRAAYTEPMEASAGVEADRELMHAL